MLEKLQLAEEESYKDPANIQSKHQKHQAFEAELAANADRIETVLKMGQKLIENRKCSGSEEAVQQRLEMISEQWETLTRKTSEKSMKLKEANRQRTFIAAVKVKLFSLKFPNALYLKNQKKINVLRFFKHYNSITKLAHRP